MKTRPIIFSGNDVRAILEGRKTQFRRVVKFEWSSSREALMNQATFDPAYKCPYGQPGDRLWVRETWGMSFEDIVIAIGRQFVSGGTWGSDDRPDRKPCVVFRADGDMPDNSPHETARWSTPVQMPRWASRITLEIVSVRVERLNDISAEDAELEGCNRFVDSPGSYDARVQFCELWESIHGHVSLDLNQWVWVIEFKEVRP